MSEISLYLSLGSNLGNREEFINKAKVQIGQSIGTVKESSSIYETQPWGFKDQGIFLNQVIRIKTALDPEDILERILEIERNLGRIRKLKNGPRTIDIDILLAEDRIILSDKLTIPHARLATRKFILTPLAEIAPDLIHPILKCTISNMLAKCIDHNFVIKYNLHEIKS